MMWAVSVYERWEDGTWEFIGYVKVFRSQDAALKGNADYQKCQKCFNLFVNKVVSSMISNYLLNDDEVDSYYRHYTRITEKA